MGRNMVVTSIELSYFDFWRQAGLFSLIGFLFCVFYPLKKLCRRENYWLIFGSVGYLIIAGTNPLLFSTTAYLLYIVIYSEYYFAKERKASEVLNSNVRV